jgi:heme O synthase-like polyprenyltransferase
MLPKGNARVPVVILQTLLPLLVLVAVSVMQSPARYATVFHWAATLLGAGFLYFGLKFLIQRSGTAARRLLMASIVYLPLLCALSATLCN